MEQWYSCFGTAAPSCKWYSSHGLSVSEGFKLDIYIIIVYEVDVVILIGLLQCLNTESTKILSVTV
jgi:hypothetical protein